MRTLDRYLLRLVGGRFALLLTVFVAVVVGGQLGAFIGRGAPPDALLPIIPAAIFLALPIAVPLAVSTALLVVVGGMVRSGEFQALAAAGVDPKRVVLRLWPFIALAALLSAALSHLAMPLAIRDIRANKSRILQAAIATQVANLRPIWDQDGTSAWASHVDGRNLSDVYLRRKEGDGDLAAYAPRASWALTRGGIEFRLDDVRIIERRSGGEVLTGEAARYVIQPTGDRDTFTEPDALSTPAVIEELRNAPSRGPDCSRFNNARLTLHLRCYMPMALFAYALFAVGLGMVAAMGEVLGAVAVIVVVVALAAYPAIGYVKSNASAEQFDPGLFLWLPGLLLAYSGWWMLSHPELARERLAQPGHALGSGFRRLTARLRRPSDGAGP